MDAFDRMLELSREGFFCAQIMLALALEAEGKENPDLLRAMGGLNGGLGNTGSVCGVLTGGACLISYFAGKGEADELQSPDCDAVIAEFSEWFHDYCAEYGGCDCRIILNGDPKNKLQRCPLMVQAAFEKCMELLEGRGLL
ncbi:MAG: C-GCAxxG-C-C family protein [Oscillospiraceae bacterium]